MYNHLAEDKEEDYVYREFGDFNRTRTNFINDNNLFVCQDENGALYRCRRNAITGAIEGERIYSDHDLVGANFVPYRAQQMLRNQYSAIDMDNSDDFESRGSMGSLQMDEYSYPPTKRVKGLQGLKVIDDEELFMHFTMEKNEKLIKMQTGYINFMIIGQNDALMHCRMRIHMRFRRMMRIYADSLGLSRHVLYYKYNGNTIGVTDTPDSIELVEGDTIVVAQRRKRGANIATVD